jgi:hypothetical protein
VEDKKYRGYNVLDENLEERGRLGDRIVDRRIILNRSERNRV